MPIYKPSELITFLENLGISPRKGLSQNFLVDGNILRKIIQTADVQPGDIVLEIGPGPGSLTELLLQAGASVIAVEKDVVLAQALGRMAESGPLEVHCQDILEFPIEEAFKDRLKQKKAKVIANLPYHLTTPILALLAPLHEIFSSLTLMVQEEVARRFAASSGTSDYGSFTVFLNFYSKPSYAFKVGRRCFFPPPKVDSAVVHLNLIPPPPVAADSFFKLTRTAFQQRRKMIKVSLKALYEQDKILHALTVLKLNPLARPEELSLEQWLALYQQLNP
jgi:16S rRNA (adenine1518-N6/adenine1519-N6)-dimethyltransferase